jgi:hypothetical protein
MERKGNNETKRPPFLISPPGSLDFIEPPTPKDQTEAAQTDYINIPKIANDPPPELLGERGLHEFTDPFKDSYLPKWAREIRDDDDRMYYLQPSNVWILGEWIENLIRFTDTNAKREELTDKGEVSDFLFPQFLHFYLKWILCEYGLYCAKQKDELGLTTFIKNIIGLRISHILKKHEQWSDKECKEWFDKVFSAKIALRKMTGRWRKAQNPIWSLRATISEIRKAHREDENKSKEWFGGQKNYISINQPISTGGTLNPHEVTLLDRLFSEDVSFETTLFAHDVIELCRCIWPSSPISALLKATREIYGITLTEAAELLNLSEEEYGAGKTKYNAVQKAIKRKEKEFDLESPKLIADYKPTKQVSPYFRHSTKKPKSLWRAHKCPECSKIFSTLYRLTNCADHIDEEEV